MLVVLSIQTFIPFAEAFGNDVAHKQRKLILNPDLNNVVGEKKADRSHLWKNIREVYILM